MRILLLTHYYPPEINAPAQRAEQHAKEWIKEGHEVTIVTAAPAHPYGIVYEGYSNEYSESEVEGVKIIRMHTFLGANKGFAKRTLNYLSYFFAAIFNVRKIGRHDVVISSSPQFFCGLAGVVFKAYYRIPWILEIRDLWPESIIAVGAAKTGITTRLVSNLAKWAYKISDAIVSVSPGFNEHFKTYGVQDHKLHLIPNGIQSTSTHINSSKQISTDLEQLNGRFIAAFIGTLGMAHGVDTILSAADILRDNRKIGFLIVGSGAEYEALVSKKNDLKLDNVLFLGQQSRENVAQIWNHVSASIVHLKKNDTFKTVIPTKLLEGMAMKRPVIIGVEGTAKNILESANSGIAIEPENATELASAVETLHADPELASTFANNGYQYVNKNFDRAKMASKYLVLMQSITDAKPLDKFKNAPFDKT